MLSLPCTVYDRILLCLFLVFLTLFWAFLSFQIHPSSISMEIYLSHMVIFRVIERLGFNTIIGNGWGQYIVTVVIVLVITTIFSVVMKKILHLLGEKVSRKMS